MISSPIAMAEENMSSLDADLGALKSHPDCVTDDEAKLMREIAKEVAK